MYVKYNGEKISYQGCTGSPVALQKGRIYKVVGRKVYPYQTDYTLDSLPGEYNSCWFDEVPTYFAFGKEIPKRGKMMDVYREEVRKGKVFLELFHTTPVHQLEQISSNTYIAVTANTVYIVQVLS